MTETKTATIEKRERQSYISRGANWQGGTSYEWVTVFYKDGERIMSSVSRTRREARERAADLGFEVVK